MSASSTSGDRWPGTLTVLRTPSSDYPATKQWTWQQDCSEWRPISYDAGWLFYPAEQPIASLCELAAVLERLSRDPQAYVVRGGLAPWVHDEMRTLGRPIWRRKHRKNGPEPSIVEVSCPWLMLDIDNFPLRLSDDLADDPESAIEYAITELLPEPFWDAACWWQLSSSAGFVPGILKVHLFFWLTEPATNEHIKAVLKQHAPGIDLAPFSATQPHYIAAPLIVGAPDPLPRRTGWRKGSDDAVTLPALRPAARQRNHSAGYGGAGDTVEAALTVLGDGPGLQGFHAPLRTATWRYATRCLRYGDRDDASLRLQLQAAIQKAPRRPSRANIDEYLSIHYQQRLIDGAFAVLARPARPPMPPYHEAATETLGAAQNALTAKIRDFLSRTKEWHVAPEDERGDPEHAGVAASLGLGKSSIARSELPPFVADEKAAELPRRVLWTVPYHSLGRDAEQAMLALGVAAMVWRGRDATDPDADDPKTKMCLATDAVADALKIGADIERSVCGDPDSDECCPFHRACGYQRQKAAAAAAEVVIAAHNILFHALPKALKKNLALVITDEAWWQTGLQPALAIEVASFTEDIAIWPVLRDANARYGLSGRKRRRGRGTPLRQVMNQSGCSELQECAAKAGRAFDAILAANPDGGFVSREAVAQSGLTVALCKLARQREWQRKVEDALKPGMAPEARKAALKAAAVNATIPRRAGIWRALEELLDGDDTHTGRLEITRQADASGSHAVILLHDRMPLCDAVLSLPILVLDATLPASLVRHYLPRLSVLADLKVAAPHCDTFLVTGGWGKTSIIPHPKTGVKENARRERLLGELRDFVTFYSGGNALVVTYAGIEDRFANFPGVRTGHFSAINGLDSFGDVRSLFVIGRPLASPDDLRRLALALTGKALPDEATRIESRGQRMIDGSGLAVDVRAYGNPDLEAVRTAITDTAVVQAAGRGREIRRTATTPLTLFLFADVVVPLPAKDILRWPDIRLTPSQRMAARGLVLESPTDAARVYPDLFASADAAKKALQRGSKGTFPYELSSIGECPRAPLVEGRYRLLGPSYKTRRFAVAEHRRDHVRSELETALGPLALFELEMDEQPAEKPAPPGSTLTDAAPLVPGSYGELLDVATMLSGFRLTPPQDTLWKLHRSGQPPWDMVDLGDDEVWLLEPEMTLLPLGLPSAGKGWRASEDAADGSLAEPLEDTVRRKPVGRRAVTRYAPGDTITQTARGVTLHYTLLDAEPYRNAKGQHRVVLTWTGQCATCGAAFDAKSGRRARYLQRRCVFHRRTHGLAIAEA